MSDWIIFGASVFCSIVSAFAIVSWYASHYKTKIDNINETCKSINGLHIDIGILKDFKIRAEKFIEERSKANFTQSKSPLSLTDKGKVVLLDSGGKDFIDKNKDELLDSIKLKAPKTEYDIQEFSKEVINSCMNRDEFIPIKEYLYKESSIPKEPVMEVLGIYLRDIYINEIYKR